MKYMLCMILVFDFFAGKGFFSIDSVKWMSESKLFFKICHVIISHWMMPSYNILSYDVVVWLMQLFLMIMFHCREIWRLWRLRARLRSASLAPNLASTRLLAAALTRATTVVFFGYLLISRFHLKQFKVNNKHNGKTTFSKKNTFFHMTIVVLGLLSVFFTLIFYVAKYFACDLLPLR